MANEMNGKLEEFLDEHPEFKGKFVGFKSGRGLGISRIDNDWYECDRYLIELDDLIEVFDAGANKLLKAKLEIAESLVVFELKTELDDRYSAILTHTPQA